MQKCFWAILALIGLFACSLIGCGGGGESVAPDNPNTPIPLTASAVKPDPHETVSRYTWVVITPPDPNLEYGIGVADQKGEIPEGEWWYWTRNVDQGEGFRYHTVPQGEYHIPKGAIEVGFTATYGWVGRLDPGETFTVVFFAEKNNFVDPRVDWQWSFTVDPNRPADCE